MKIAMKFNTIGCGCDRREKRVIVENKTMMQYFEWYLPEDGLFWRRCAAQAGALRKAGVNMVWLPPAYKGASGKRSVGYDVYDTYDLGEFAQKGSIATKYGCRRDYLRAVKHLQSQGIEVMADVVLNHMMGADATETVIAEEVCPSNRVQPLREPQQITAWTAFSFQGRRGKYSRFRWNASHFSGIDLDVSTGQSGIFRFRGKEWNEETDSENVNYDYLMGADLDTDCPETVEAVTKWGRWYLNTVKPDGLRLDAVKHISFDFYRRWLRTMRRHARRDLFVVGEYWSDDLNRLTHYLDVTKNSLSLFDVPLHYHLLQAANANGQFDMRTLFDNTLVGVKPECSVTFVDNHDTQPGQALFSFIPAWFKPIAYALILLGKEGIPCIFYGDYYGIPHDNIAPTPSLKKLIKLRERFAYGEQRSYFDDASVVGFTRLGDREHPGSGMAVLVTDSAAGEKRMYVGSRFAGSVFYDALASEQRATTIDSEGYGAFYVGESSAAAWVTEQAYQYTRVEME